MPWEHTWVLERVDLHSDFQISKTNATQAQGLGSYSFCAIGFAFGLGLRFGSWCMVTWLNATSSFCLKVSCKTRLISTSPWTSLVLKFPVFCAQCQARWYLVYFEMIQQSLVCKKYKMESGDPAYSNPLLFPGSASYSVHLPLQVLWISQISSWLAVP